MGDLNSWDPSVLDRNLDNNQNWFDAILDLEAQPFTSLFDEFGDYRKRIIVQDGKITALDDLIIPFFDAADTLDNYVDHDVYRGASCSDLLVHHGTLTPSPCLVSPKLPDYKRLCPFFGWMSTDVIKRTFEVTTQYACIPMSTLLKK
jgi:hypothetical protein